MKTLGERLHQAMSDAGLTEAELARRSGLKQPTVHRILTGQSKDPRQNNLEKIAMAVSRSAGWLRTGKDLGDGIPNVTNAAEGKETYYYPVISSVAAGSWSESVNPFYSDTEAGYESTDYKSKGEAFWLEVKGDSMTSPTGLSIPEGMLILVDPEEPATSGSLVVAQLDDSDDTTFKRLVIDGGLQYLKPLNPSYPVIHINSGCCVIGVVVEAKIRLRFTRH